MRQHLLKRKAARATLALFGALVLVPAWLMAQKSLNPCTPPKDVICPASGTLGLFPVRSTRNGFGIVHQGTGTVKLYEGTSTNSITLNGAFWAGDQMPGVSVSSWSAACPGGAEVLGISEECQ